MIAKSSGRVKRLALKDVRQWKQPRHSKADDPTWWAVFIDPAQLGIAVEIPEWMERRGQGGRQG